MIVFNLSVGIGGVKDPFGNGAEGAGRLCATQGLQWREESMERPTYEGRKLIL